MRRALQATVLTRNSEGNSPDALTRRCDRPGQGILTSLGLSTVCLVCTPTRRSPA